jgi:hypothetical protein
MLYLVKEVATMIGEKKYWNEEMETMPLEKLRQL